MKKLKKILLALVLVVIVIFSTGCASIQYQRIINEDGKIIDAVSVKLDTEKISSAGYNIEKVTEDVKNRMQNYLNQVINAFLNREDGLLEIEKYSVYNNVFAVVTKQEDYIIASIEFKNYNTFKYFYGLHLNEDLESEDEENLVKTFLFNKNVSSGKTIFSGQDAEVITSDFMSYFNNDFTLDDCNLSYVFGTPENKIHSNATYTFTEGGINYHQWILTSKDDEISTYTYQMKPVNWYILALVLTVVLIVVLFIVSFFIKKPKEEDINSIEIKDNINGNEE